MGTQTQKQRKCCHHNLNAKQLNREVALMVPFMARILKITIEESVEFLEKQLKNTRTASQRERIQVLWWLKTGQVQQHQELANRLGRDKSTITRWLQKYRLVDCRNYCW